MCNRFPISTTLWTFFTEAYKPLKLRGCSVLTVAQYRIQLGHLSRFLGRDATLADLDDLTISRFLDDRAAQTSRANSNKARNHVLALWRFAARKGLVESWPDVDKMSEPDLIPQAWTKEQIDRLFSACAATPGTYGAVRACDFWLALHWLLWNTGERKGALLAVEVEHFDLQGATVAIPAELRKGGCKSAVYPLWPETIAAIQRLLACAKPGRLFDVNCDRSTFYYRYRKLLKRAELPVGRFCGPHRMRKSFATHLTAAGGNAMQALGHDDLSTTIKHYIDPTIAKPADHSRLIPKPKLPPEAA